MEHTADRKYSALLSNEGNLTSFQFGGQNIRFRTPDILQRYVAVKEWNHGYLVVLADYQGLGVQEEYIDILPVLENLCIDADSFLKPIKSVTIKAADHD